MIEKMKIRPQMGKVIIAMVINATMQLLKNYLENYDEDNPTEWLDLVYIMLQICLRGEK